MFCRSGHYFRPDQENKKLLIRESFLTNNYSKQETIHHNPTHQQKNDIKDKLEILKKLENVDSNIYNNFKSFEYEIGDLLIFSAFLIHKSGDNLTNNDAEYQAIIFALKKFKALFGKSIAKISDVEIRSDSELVVKQLNGDYRLSEPKIQQFFIEIWNLKFDFKSVKFKHIPREKNKEADKLVNEALDAETKSNPLF